MNRLTPKQCEVIEYMIKGYNDTEIAKILGVGSRGVSMRIWRAMNSLGSLNRSQLTSIYLDMKRKQS